MKKEAYLSSENIKSKPIKTTDDSLLNVQSKVIECPHCWEQKAWSTGTKHMNVDCFPFSFPDFHLHVCKGEWLQQCNWQKDSMARTIEKRNQMWDWKSSSDIPSYRNQVFCPFHSTFLRETLDMVRIIKWRFLKKVLSWGKHQIW